MVGYSVSVIAAKVKINRGRQVLYTMLGLGFGCDWDWDRLQWYDPACSSDYDYGCQGFNGCTQLHVRVACVYELLLCIIARHIHGQVHSFSHCCSHSYKASNPQPGVASAHSQWLSFGRYRSEESQQAVKGCTNVFWGYAKLNSRENKRKTFSSSPFQGLYRNWLMLFSKSCNILFFFFSFKHLGLLKLDQMF